MSGCVWWRDVLAVVGGWWLLAMTAALLWAVLKAPDRRWRRAQGEDL